MELSSILTSLEVSKKLDELEFKTDTCFYWHKTVPGFQGDDAILMHYKEDDITNDFTEALIRSYSFEQLFNLLPIKFNNLVTTLTRKNEILLMEIDKRKPNLDLVRFNNNNLADLAAEALIWCIENNYIDVKNIRV